ncbi:MAG TPA: EAL domain-containing protein [Alcaligenaceae bacterium]|nr:EAL domain-containing protein [Alcaligenaceae bacterium]
MQRISTERARINKQQNQLFLSLANNSLIGIGVIKNDRFVFSNRHLAQMTGYERQELIALPDVQQILPDFYTELERFPEDCNEKLIETKLLHYSGKRIDIELCLLRTRFDGDDAIVVFVLDNTARKNNERNAQLAALVYENSTEAIVVTDESGVIVGVNPAFVEITGYQLSEVIGRTMNLLASGRQSPAFYKKMWRQLKKTGRWRGDIWNRRKNGEEYAERLNISTCYNEDGTVFRRIGLFFDVTQDKEREQQIWRQANHDHLTGLPNRQLFQGRLQKAMQDADERNKAFALIFLDLDLFKDVNDTLGHNVGDQLLKEASKRLLSCVRDTDTVARIGGDEFTVIVSDVPNQAVVERICEEILVKIAQPYQLGENVATVSASIGVTMYPEDASDAGEILKNADMAMYAAKECGRNQYCFFLPAMSEAIQARILFSQNLQTAIAENQFILYYQPIIDMRTGQVRKFEALIRWDHPELGLVPPSEYIPFAEDSGLIVDIGQWVFKAAVQQAKRWHEQGLNYQISVNVSPAQFYADGIKVEEWVRLLEDAGLPTSSILIEITERLLLEENPAITKRLRQLREAGLQIALDDFGTGFSSLTYLKRYPIDYLKIDQSFVRNLAPESEDLALCEAMIVMAQKLGLGVIAEGVEGPLQQSLLLEAGCVLGQGYLYSRPVPPQEIERWLDERKALPTNTSSSNDQRMAGQLLQDT